MLFVYYQYCHPWKSEGVSVGFTPKKDEKATLLQKDYEDRKKIERFKNASKNIIWRYLNLNEGKIQIVVLYLKQFKSENSYPSSLNI